MATHFKEIRGKYIELGKTYDRDVQHMLKWAAWYEDEGWLLEIQEEYAEACRILNYLEATMGHKWLYGNFDKNIQLTAA